MNEKPVTIDTSSGVLTKESLERFVAKTIALGGTPTPSITLPDGYTYAECERWLANKLGVTK